MKISVVRDFNKLNNQPQITSEKKSSSKHINQH